MDYVNVRMQREIESEGDALKESRKRYMFLPLPLNIQVKKISLLKRLVRNLLY